LVNNIVLSLLFRGATAQIEPRRLPCRGFKIRAFQTVVCVPLVVYWLLEWWYAN